MVSIFNRAKNNQPRPTVKYKKGKNVLNKTSGTEKLVFGIMFALFAIYALSSGFTSRLALTIGISKTRSQSLTSVHLCSPLLE